jgi:hypothetical protein
MLIVGACAVAHAAEFDVQGDFASKPGANGLPAGWVFHTWEGYLPKPMAKVVEGDAKGTFALSVDDVRGKHGAGVMSAVKRAGTCRDHVTVGLTARGRGKAWVTLVRWNEKRAWNQTESRVAIDLTDEWTAHECLFVLHDGPSGETKSFQVELGLDKGSEACFADVSADHSPACPEERAAAVGKVARTMKRFIDTSREIASDDFEDAARVRSPSPELVQDIIAPGLLSKTTLGVYRGDRPFTVQMPGGGGHALPESAGNYLSANARIYDFGRRTRTAARARLGFSVSGGGAARTVFVDVESDPARADLVCTVLCDGERSGRIRVPVKSLPADFMLGVAADGAWLFSATSLSDSSSRVRRGSCAPFPKGATAEASLEVVPNAGSAEITLDTLALRETKETVKDTTPPIILERAREFDPVKAGWPLVFADEFDGDSLDWSKWFVPWYKKKDSARHFSLDGKGHLVLKVEKDPKTGKLDTGSIWSKDSWRYGYFEARLRYTRKPGWWSAFWMYGIANRNPFWDGFEIDIQEDYYTRPKTKGGPERRTIDHNLHVYTGPLLKSWNYNSELPGSLDDFYTLGCKWTPFEISYYVNGKLLSSKAAHSPHDSVTFDAFNHAYGIVPLHAIVSGQIMGKQWFASDIEGVEFPEEYVLDHVRVYKFPEEDGTLPEVDFAKDQDRSLFVKTGDRLSFSATARPAAKTRSPVKAVYLFDDGYLIDFKTEPPYEFTLPFTKERYSSTCWAQGGRSGARPAFDSYPHVFVVAAQDAAGRVSHSGKIVKILRNADGFEPHDNADRTVPAFVPAWTYDDGGQGVAYHDTTVGNKFWGRKMRPLEDVDAGPDGLYYTDTGEWLNYTLRVEKGGDFAITAKCGDCGDIPGVRRVPLYMDGKLLGTFEVEGVRPDAGRTLKARLPAGRHTFTVLLHSPITFKGLDFAE